MKDNKERFEVIATKIDPAMSEVLNACCDALQVDVYHHCTEALVVFLFQNEDELRNLQIVGIGDAECLLPSGITLQQGQELLNAWVQFVHRC